MAKTSKSALKLSCLKDWMAENKLPKPRKVAEDIEEKGITRTYSRKYA